MDTLVQHFGWPVPTGSPQVSTQDRVTEGRSDIRLTFPSGALVVLELKAGPAPEEHQLRKYDKGAQVIGLATTPQVYPFPELLGTSTWADLVNVPWTDPPLAWRQLVRLAHATGVAVPTVDLSALAGLQASYDAQGTFTSWTRIAADRIAQSLSGGGAVFSVQNGVRGRRFDERDHRRQVSWTWAPPWSSHPWAGVWNGLFFGFPHAPVLVSGAPDLVLCWQCQPGSALHEAMRTDPALLAAIGRWTTRNGDGALRTWTPEGWPLIQVRQSSTLLLGQVEAGQTYLNWIERMLKEWAEDGITERLRVHNLPLGNTASGPDTGPPLSETGPDAAGSPE